MSKKSIKTIRGPVANFDVPVEVTALNGVKDTVVFSCKARSRTEWMPHAKEISTKRFDAMLHLSEQVKADEDKTALEKLDDMRQKVQEIKDKDVVGEAMKHLKETAAYALLIADGWDYEEPLTEENIIAVEDIYPGTIEGLIEAYTKAINGLRTKN